ncbi:MAG TPA: S8 family serine peptidase, partial [Chloroflexota bacterium]
MLPARSTPWRSFVHLDRLVVGACLLCVLVGTSSAAGVPGTAEAAGPRQRYIVLTRPGADIDTVKAAAQRNGAAVNDNLRDNGMLVVSGSAGLPSQIQATGLVDAVVKDRVEKLVLPGASRDGRNTGPQPKIRLDAATSQAIAAAQQRRPIGDPAFAKFGLMWSIDRIEAPAAWQTTTGSAQVRVGVADTGLDFTHSDLGPRIASVVDFTGSEDPPLCKDLLGLGVDDADLANKYGGPPTTDWNGHGSWVGGNIAAALDGQGVNGIAPNVKLVSLKIGQWCGQAYDSTLLMALDYASTNNIDIVNVSLGGYLDRTDPDQDTLWRIYRRVIQRARNKGTIITAASGNEHLRVDSDGKVTSHGSLTIPGDPLADYFGQFAAPGGVPGVVYVSSTVNVVVPSSDDCHKRDLGTADDPNSPVCKPRSDRHQAAGQGRQDQLAYYSDYGPRIDVAGPGGARKFNLPAADRGGTLGFPLPGSDGTIAYGDFSTTSNWAVLTPCFMPSGRGFAANQCYTTLQGTSMAAPHAAGVLALIASANPSARGNPDRLERILKDSARTPPENKTQELSGTDTSNSDLTDLPCSTGYCHLGGQAV